jgi:hypothetical protein
MKKILTFLAITFVFLFVTLQCTKDIPLCQQNHFGYVKIINSTSIYLNVDATESGSNYNAETRLAPGQYVKISVASGSVEIWAASDYNKSIDSWNTDYATVYDCDTYTYTWTNKKSASIPVSKKPIK